MEKWYAGFTRNGSREESFPRPRRPHQQYSAWDARPNIKEFFGTAEKVHNFNQFFFGLFRASHIFKKNALLHVVRRNNARSRLAEGKCLHPALLQLARRKPDEKTN